MKTLEIPLPEEVAGSKEDLTQIAKVALALRLYGLGKIGSAQGAELAGLSRADFLLETARFGAPTVALDADELSAEAAALS